MAYVRRGLSELKHNITIAGDVGRIARRWWRPTATLPILPKNTREDGGGVAEQSSEKNEGPVIAHENSLVGGVDDNCRNNDENEENNKCDDAFLEEKGILFSDGSITSEGNDHGESIKKVHEIDGDDSERVDAKFIYRFCPKGKACDNQMNTYNNYPYAHILDPEWLFVHVGENLDAATQVRGNHHTYRCPHRGCKYIAITVVHQSPYDQQSVEHNTEVCKEKCIRLWNDLDQLVIFKLGERFHIKDYGNSQENTVIEQTQDGHDWNLLRATRVIHFYLATLIMSVMPLQKRNFRFNLVLNMHTLLMLCFINWILLLCALFSLARFMPFDSQFVFCLKGVCVFTSFIKYAPKLVSMAVEAFNFRWDCENNKLMCNVYCAMTTFEAFLFFTMYPLTLLLGFNFFLWYHFYFKNIYELVFTIFCCWFCAL